MAIRKSALPPEQYAREVLHLLKVNQIPIPVTDILDSFNIGLLYKESLDADGILISKGSRTLIIVQGSIASYTPRQQFTIAHEIGHFYLPWHKEYIYVCDQNDMNNYKPALDYEYEANRFAAELLMPDPLFTSDVKRLDLCLDSIRELAQKYQTSLTSTAIRFAQRTSMPGAIFGCQNGRIAWAAKTNGLENMDLRRGLVSGNSFAHDYFVDRTMKSGIHRVDPGAWISFTDNECDYAVFEESIPIQGLNQTISIISIVTD